MNKKMFTEEEMIAELKDNIERLGGTVLKIDLFNRTFDIDISEELEEQLFVLIESTMEYYYYERTKLEEKNPLMRVQHILRDLEEKDDAFNSRS